MDKKKSVWRVTKGRGVPSDLGSFLVYVGLPKKEKVQGFHFNHDHKWTLIGYKDIAFYQTTRTKAAKYERVECGVCDGDGFYLGENSRVERTCRHCNGKGYRLEVVK